MEKADSKASELALDAQIEIQNVFNNTDDNIKKIFMEWFLKTDNKELKDTSILPKEYQNVFEKLNQVNEFRFKAIRYFWQKCVQKYGLKYETNYTTQKPKIIHYDKNNNVNFIVNVTNDKN